MKRRISRRDSLKLACAGGLSGLLGRSAMALRDTSATSQKLLVIFLRGGNDGINTVIPQTTQYDTLRPGGGIGIPFGDRTDIGTWARLHPALDPLLPVHTNGHITFLHRVHYDGAGLSHFANQQFYETAVPLDLNALEGFAPRLLAGTDPGVAFRGCGIGGTGLRMFNSRNPAEFLVQMNSIGDFTFFQDRDTPTAQETKLVGDVSGGIRRHFTQPAETGLRHDEDVRATGELIFEAEGQIRPLVSGSDYVPPIGVTYPPTKLGNELAEAIQILKCTDARMVGLNQGGYDTHSAQGGQMGTQASLLNELAFGLKAIYDDSQTDPVTQDMLTLVVTEFGRTSEPNSSGGTDHAKASCMFVMGTGVNMGANAGVYNCDPGTWSETAMTDDDGKFLPHLTDFRTVYGELMIKHFGLSTLGQLDFVMPGFGALAGTQPQFTQLGYLL